MAGSRAAAQLDRLYVAGPNMPPALLDDRAACRPFVGTDRMFPPERGQRAWRESAKRICGPCPLAAQCLKWALDKALVGEPPDGVWGGTSGRERKVLVAEIERRRAAAAARREAFARRELERLKDLQVLRRAHEQEWLSIGDALVAA